MASSGPEAAEVDPPERAGDVDRERGEALVLELLGAHADSLLRVARRYSMCIVGSYRCGPGRCGVASVGKDADPPDGREC
jgi:hypothetical protein